jgi:hypothetical protein
MAHEDAGHYGAKHPGATIDADIANAIREREKEGRITCAAAHEIARKQDCTPKQVGVNIDLLEKRINKCQLGLFGYGEPKGKAVEAASAVPEDFERAIREAATDGRISCEAAWDIADRLERKRIDVACACEAMGIKVSTCQLGAF